MNQDALLQNLEDFQAWRRGKSDFDLLDYMMCVGTPDVLVAMLELACPELVEFDGDLFIKSRFDKAVYREWSQRCASKSEVQRMMNHLHVSSFMQGRIVSDEIAVFVSQRLAEVWSRVFAAQGLSAEAWGSDLESAQVTLFKPIAE